MFTNYTQVARTVFKEWRRRSRSRRELAVLGGCERHDLSCRFDIHSEMRKPFWQA
jgi:uncharacterized protein YjiS (DUF1127 family)